MALQALQDLFRRHRDKATGLWKLGQTHQRTIYFDSGDIVFAQSTHPGDRLTSMLVERGKLTQAQLEYALANLKPGKSIGKNLIEMGFITQRDLLDVARAQVERVVSSAMGSTEDDPTFEGQEELDMTVVRLPFFTPELLLNAMLAQQNREALLELLGPLNQVVVLQGRKLQELTLPPDLAKLSPLLDGTHTLLELSRESLAEPLRLGTFALFLREMHWARLHEMPPLDKSALDLALADPEPLSPPLPEAPAQPNSALFASIHAAALPTTNLEHLAQALDAIPEGVPQQQTPVSMAEDEGDTRPFLPLTPSQSTETSLAEEIPPTVPTPFPANPRDTAPQPLQLPEGVVLPTAIAPQIQEPLHEEDHEAPLPPAPQQQRNPVLMGAALTFVLGLCAYVGWRIMRQSLLHRPSKPAAVKSTPTPPPPVPPTTPPPAPPAETSAAPSEPKGEAAPVAKTVSQAPQSEPVPKQSVTPTPPPPVEPKTPLPATVAEKKPTPEPSSTAAYAIQDRLEALRKGDIPLALKQGEAQRQALPANHWALRLVVACQAETLKKAVEAFGEEPPDLWVLPWRLSDGRPCYQLFLAHYPNKKEAEKRISSLPEAFVTGGNRPRAFRIQAIPERP